MTAPMYSRSFLPSWRNKGRVAVESTGPKYKAYAVTFSTWNSLSPTDYGFMVLSGRDQ